MTPRFYTGSGRTREEIHGRIQPMPEPRKLALPRLFATLGGVVRGWRAK